ncbi:glycosyltransferase 61 family protein [Methylobacterium sp. 37f]|uniref:glycosyltransferase family 61 protein n=1 Tax=Methylobacterium sp. 37f TaxID=2817058 RepID=UPI001FFCEE5C|nr:glycosyltransferase 61 family protein [Methylobacterium sp. 37f]MCK2056494.1 glycosyltransferase family 61 protein [Methylobacterium sp. 37f]
MAVSEPDLLSADDVIDLRRNVEGGRGTVIDVTRAERSRLMPPAFLAGAVTPDLLRLYHAQHVVLGTAVYALPDAEIVGEGMILTDGRFNLSLDLQTDLDYLNRHHRGTRARQAEARRVQAPGRSVLLAGPGHLGYGHWLVDFLPKLHLLRAAGYRVERLSFLLPDDTPGFARAWLALLGIGESQCRFYDRTRDRVACDELLVPSTLRFGTRVSPLFAEAAAGLRRAALGRGRGSRTRTKLFVARSANALTHSPRQLVQRQLFEDLAVARGFTRVTPERLGLREQVALFQSAEILVGEYGSGLHGSIFAEPGSLVLAARDNQADLGFLQSGLDAVMGHQTGYLIGAPDPEGGGGFSVDPADLALAFDWLSWPRDR